METAPQVKYKGYLIDVKPISIILLSLLRWQTIPRLSVNRLTDLIKNSFLMADAAYIIYSP